VTPAPVVPVAPTPGEPANKKSSSSSSSSSEEKKEPTPPVPTLVPTPVPETKKEEPPKPIETQTKKKSSSSSSSSSSDEKKKAPTPAPEPKKPEADQKPTKKTSKSSSSSSSSSSSEEKVPPPKNKEPVSTQRLSLQPRNPTFQLSVDDPVEDAEGVWQYLLMVNTDLPQYKQPTKTWSLRRRYNQWRALYERISTHGNLTSWFHFPERALFNTSAVIQERLQAFTKLAAYIEKDEKLRASTLIVRFLDPEDPFNALNYT